MMRNRVRGNDWSVWALGLLAWVVLAAFAVPAFAATDTHGAEATHGAGDHGTGGHGAAAHHEGEGISSLGWPLANFAIFAAIIAFAYRKKVAPVLQQRTIEFQQFLQRAGSELANVEREIAIVNGQLGRLDQERGEIMERIRVEGEQIATSLIESARNDARKIEADAVRQREYELKRVQKELSAQLVAQAADLARAKLTNRVSEDDDRRLRDEVLTTLMN